MTGSQIEQVKALEGRRICLAVRGGDRIDECELVSAGRGEARTLWIFADGADRFVPVDDVLDVWEAA